MVRAEEPEWSTHPRDITRDELHIVQAQCLHTRAS